MIGYNSFCDWFVFVFKVIPQSIKNLSIRTMKKIGIALTLLCGGASTHAQNGGQLKQAQVSTARQTPQQITDQYWASQKALHSEKWYCLRLSSVSWLKVRIRMRVMSIILPAYSSFRFSPRCGSMMNNSWVFYRAWIQINPTTGWKLRCGKIKRLKAKPWITANN